MYDIALALSLKEFCSKLYFTFTGAFFFFKKKFTLKIILGLIIIGA